MAEEKTLDMSLDEYIASFKKQKSEATASKTKNESKFKAERRKFDGDDMDDDKMDEDEPDAESTGIWRGPDSNTAYIDLDFPHDDEFDAMLKDNDESNVNTSMNQSQLRNQRQPKNNTRFDLREKISGSPVPNCNSQQWRLMRPNVMNQRPAGMPPLVPQNTFEQRQMQQQRGNRGNRNGRRWGNNNRNNGFMHNNNGCPMGNCNFNHNNMFNGGRIQRGQQRNNDILNANLRQVLERLSRESGYPLPQEVRDLTIECPADSINLSSNPYNRNPPMNQVPSATVTMNNAFQVQNPVENNKSNDGLRAVLGINDPTSLKTEMMPMLATKFLDFLQNGAQQTVHKPIYDLKIQKEIHEVQKKPLMYKCPGGEVVSSDGAGINNCEIIPRTSGISLNHRFA